MPDTQLTLNIYAAWMNNVLNLVLLKLSKVNITIPFTHAEMEANQSEPHAKYTEANTGTSRI